MQIVGNQKRFLAVSEDVLGEFSSGCGFTAPLQTGQHNHGRPGRDIINPAIYRPHQLGQLIADDFDHYLAGMKALYHLSAKCGLCNVLAECLDDIVVNVRLEEGLSDLPHGVRDIRLGNSPPAGKRPEDRVKFFRQ